MRVQLLYFVGCPHVDATRRVLRAALEASAVGDVAVEEFDVEAPSTPPELRGWGSPTILVDGVDLTGERVPSGLSCRLYRSADAAGVPSRKLIEERLRAAKGSENTLSRWLRRHGRGPRRSGDGVLACDDRTSLHADKRW